MSSVNLFGAFVFLVLISSLIFSVFLFFYNLLVKREEKVKETWSQIGNLYQEKGDLIPPLLNVVKEYARSEKETIQSVITARTKVQELVAEIEGRVYSSEEKVKDVQLTEGLLNVGLNKINDLKKEYPSLMFDMHYLTIQHKLQESNSGIIQARHKYNRVVEQYNRGLKVFPLNVFTSLFHFEHKAYFTETN